MTWIHAGSRDCLLQTIAITVGYHLPFKTLGCSWVHSTGLSPCSGASLLKTDLSKHTNISAADTLHSLQPQPQQTRQPSLTSSLGPYGSQNVAALPCIITPQCCPTSQLLHSDLQGEHTVFRMETRDCMFETALGLETVESDRCGLVLKLDCLLSWC